MMELNVVEKKKDKWKVEIKNEDHTLLNLLREYAWKKGSKQASYMIKHPYQSKPMIIISGASPKKILADSAQKISDDAKAFQKAMKGK